MNTISKYREWRSLEDHAESNKTTLYSVSTSTITPHNAENKNGNRLTFGRVF